MDEAAIQRRAEFLLTEACADVPEYCHAIQTTLRVISNEVNFGHWSSRRAKVAPPRMSRAAYELRQQLEADAGLDAKERLKRFQAETINEHQEELRQVWRWIKEKSPSLRASDIVARLQKFPPIILTVKENATLKRHLPPIERYADIAIVDGSTGESVG